MRNIVFFVFIPFFKKCILLSMKITLVANAHVTRHCHHDAHPKGDMFHLCIGFSEKKLQKKFSLCLSLFLLFSFKNIYIFIFIDCTRFFPEWCNLACSYFAFNAMQLQDSFIFWRWGKNISILGIGMGYKTAKPLAIETPSKPYVTYYFHGLEVWKEKKETCSINIFIDTIWRKPERRKKAS